MTAAVLGRHTCGYVVTESTVVAGICPRCGFLVRESDITPERVR